MGRDRRRRPTDLIRHEAGTKQRIAFVFFLIKQEGLAPTDYILNKRIFTILERN